MQRRRSYSRARRFENPVNYLFWQPNLFTEGQPDTPFPGEHQWVNGGVGSNDVPNTFVLSNLSFDTPEQTRYGAPGAAVTWEESPLNVGQKVPLNARLLWTTGTVHINLRVNDTCLVRLALFETPTNLQTAAASAKPAVITSSEILNWFWTNDTSVQSWRGMRRPRSVNVPLWHRDAVLVPYNAADGVFAGNVAKTFKVKVRHPTGNVRNSDASALQLVVGTRCRGGSTFPTGFDAMTVLKTSFVV